MTIETALSKELFIRLAILQHIQRTSFYFYALTCAGVTAYVILGGPNILLLVAWLPFMLYVLLGVFQAWRDGTANDNPLLQHTRYKFSPHGIAISNAHNKSNLKWTDLKGWKPVAGCYILTLQSGAILAIPRTALSDDLGYKFEALLNEHLSL